jgi:hypothetical protein
MVYGTSEPVRGLAEHTHGQAIDAFLEDLANVVLGVGAIVLARVRY